mgnify:CR=1 FL=1
MKVKTRKILATNKSQWTKEVIFQSGDSFFYAEENGGTDGAWQRGSGPDETPCQITRDEALARCAAWGVDEVDID